MARDLGGDSVSSTSGIWLDPAEDLTPVNLYLEFQPRQDMVETHLEEEILKPQPREDLVQHLSREEIFVEVVKEKVQQPTIIDLDAIDDDGQEEPPDTSMALGVTAQPPDLIQENAHKTELATVWVDKNTAKGSNTENNETRSESSELSNELGEHARDNGFNISMAQSIAERPIAERPSPGNGHLASRPGHLASRPVLWDGPPRWSSSNVGILTVQCARCLKWRVVPSKEQYEAIREHILETPWVCENALEWRPDAHCDLPTHLHQDSQMLWAIDRPNLPSSPPGWQRKVIVRSDCSTKFADVYYTSPDGKTLRSMVEVAKYLEENPGSVPEGTKLNQFSYTIPQPLPGVWSARKRNTAKSIVSQGKKARAPQPLAKQLAQRLLHGTNPPLLPIAPPCPLPVAPFWPVPTAPSLSLPHELPFVQPLASLGPSFPPAPNFTYLPSLPSLPLPLPSMRNPYPHYPHSIMAFAGNHHSQALQQVTCSSSDRGMLTSSTVGLPHPDPSSTSTSVPRRKSHQQKSRLGVATSLTENLNLPGILPLREPNGV